MSAAHGRRGQIILLLQKDGAERLRNIFPLLSPNSIGNFISRLFQMKEVEFNDMVDRTYDRISTCKPTLKKTGDFLKIKLFLRKALLRVKMLKRWYTCKFSLIKTHLPTYDGQVVLRFVIEETQKSKVHIGRVIKMVNPKKRYLTLNDLKILIRIARVKLSKGMLRIIFRSFQVSRNYFDFMRLLKAFTNSIKTLDTTYCTKCYIPAARPTSTIEETEKSSFANHFSHPLGTKTSLSNNLIIRLLECNHFMKLSVAKFFLEFDPNESGVCSHTEFIQGCSRMVKIMEKGTLENVPFQEIVSLLNDYHIMGTKLVRWKDFENDISCGCKTRDNITEVCYYVRETKIDSPAQDSGSGSEEGTIITCEEDDVEKRENEKNIALNRRSINEKRWNRDARSLWNNAPIEMVGSVPSTSAVWEEYCEKFNSSSEESFSNKMTDVDSAPLQRKTGYIDIRNASNNSAEGVESHYNIGETCKYVLRDQFDIPELVAMSEALLKFNHSVDNVSGDCLSYIRCQYTEQTEYISFEEFIEILIDFKIQVEDEVLFTLEEWFCLPQGLDFRRLMEALYELSESQEEVENASYEAEYDEDDKHMEVEEEFEGQSTTYQEERESQDMALKNVMTQYEDMTDKALIRIRVSVFESGIPMMDILEANDREGTGCFSRREFHSIVSPLATLSDEVWSLIMYKYCRPFEPYVIPYRPFADDIDCNAKEPTPILLPLKYINSASRNIETRQTLTWVIERMGRTCTLQQVEQLFKSMTDDPESILNEEQFLNAMSEIRFITLSEKELLFSSFNVEQGSEKLFEYSRFWQCCRFIHMSFYMGRDTIEADD